MLLKCENASFGYEGKAIISDIYLAVEAGEYLCVVGENGAGKSTLIKGVLGLLKPMNGKVMYADELKGGSIGYLPQQSEAQKTFPATVMEVVLSGCLKQKGFIAFYGKKEKEKAVANMQKLGIEHLKRESYKNLSGGQQQRVLLARALCATDKLLVLDEPVTGLDPAGASELYGVLKDLNDRYQTAIIMVSHDIRGALPEVKKVLHIDQDERFYGTVDDYKGSDFGRRFLGGGADV